MNLPDCRVHNFILYAHIAPNGKVYFGITSKRLQKRWSNGNGYKNNRHFYNAIQKYGWDSFQHTIIATGLSKEFALFLEQFFISTYKSCDTNLVTIVLSAVIGVVVVITLIILTPLNKN